MRSRPAELAAFAGLHRAPRRRRWTPSLSALRLVLLIAAGFWLWHHIVDLVCMAWADVAAKLAGLQ